jgi:hypothetical protein
MDGAANANDPAKECLPPRLRTGGVGVGDPDAAAMPNEPRGLDVRKEGSARMLARLAAGLLGVDFDALWRRDRRRAFGRALQATAALTALLAATAWGGYIALSRGAEAARLHSDILARESADIDRTGVFETSLLMALQADPAAQRSAVRHLFDGKDRYLSARARLAAADVKLQLTQALRGHRDSVTAAASPPMGRAWSRFLTTRPRGSGTPGPGPRSPRSGPSHLGQSGRLLRRWDADAHGLSRRDCADLGRPHRSDVASELAPSHSGTLQLPLRSADRTTSPHTSCAGRAAFCSSSVCRQVSPTPAA